ARRGVVQPLQSAAHTEVRMRRWLAVVGIALAGCEGGAAGPFQESALGAVDVTWTNLVNCKATGSSIVKLGGQPYLADSGASTMQQLASGDGWLEFTADETQAFRFVGLTHQHAGMSGAELDFAFRLQ